MLKGKYKQDKVFVTFDKLKNFLKEFTVKELDYKFIPVDLHICLADHRPTIESLYNYLVFKISLDLITFFVIKF